MSNDKVDAQKIKIALARLHLNEAGNGGDRARAYKVAVWGAGLTALERKILRDAAHLTADEVGEQ